MKPTILLGGAFWKFELVLRGEREKLRGEDEEEAGEAGESFDCGHVMP